MKKSVSRFLYYSASIVMLFGLFLVIQGCASVSTPKATAAPQLRPTSTDEAAWQRIKDSDSPYSFEFFLNDNPYSPHVAEARQKLEALKAKMRVTHFYAGPAVPRAETAVLVTTLRAIRASGFSKPGVAGVAIFDGNEVSTYTEEIECLPGTHTVTILVQFRPDNVPGGTFGISSTRTDKEFRAIKGHKYQVAYDPSTRQASIQDMTSQ